MKAVILCGGLGTRLRQETEFRPKPTIEIGPRPILWHIMKLFAHFGHEDFVLALGYKGEVIRDYFLNYDALTQDVTVKLGGQPSVQIHGTSPESWTITMVDTGQQSMTGARVKRLQRYVNDEMFLLTYGDGVADVDLDALLAFHRAHGRIATVTGVRPPSRFGELVVDGSRVIEFSEKPSISGAGFINGGFFVFNRQVFDYLTEDDDCVLERGPLERLALAGELRMFMHEGYWQCMDTPRDLEALQMAWQQGAPWKLWRD
ncbi:MAG: glucose-1-phosphate cytidylyltransferase [Vicinamibacterales bacterium]